MSPPLLARLPAQDYSYDFEEIAATTASKKAYAFYSTAATDCWTKQANESMLKRIWFRPRVMKNVATVDTSSDIMGSPVKVPLFICPTGLAKLINPEAEKALARAAKSTGILEIVSQQLTPTHPQPTTDIPTQLSTAAGHPLEDIVSQAPNHPFLFQLYLNKDRSKSADLLARLPSLGITAIFLTVDAAGRGKRESDERLRVDEAITNPVTGERITTDAQGRGGLTRAMGSYIDQSMTWDDLAWIRARTKLPIVLKGIGGAEDAKLAMRYGVDGILLSNHGGRNLDFSPPSILLLLEMHRCCPEVFERMEVFVDGGFRRGGDIVKALCLGAKAVGIGRTFLFALHYGQEGAEHLVESEYPSHTLLVRLVLECVRLTMCKVLREEMESVMKLIGVKDLSEVHPGLVNTSDVDYLVPSTPGHPYAKWRPRPRGKARL